MYHPKFMKQITNVGILKRNSEDLEKSRKEQMRIQMALEQKAEVYDKLKSGRYKDKDNVFLVNFDDDDAEEEEVDKDIGEMIKALSSIVSNNSEFR